MGVLFPHRANIMFVLLCFILLLRCAVQSDGSKIYVTEILGKNEKIVIENKNDEEVFFYLDVNKRLFSSLKDIVEYVNNMAEAYLGESAAEKAWRLVGAHTIPLKSAISESWIHEPLPVLNSIGFGLCDDLAEVLSAIWQAQGYRTRIWMLEGHVVPEVYENRKWRMYDPSFAVYYLNKEGEVAGVEELVASPDLIMNPLRRLPVNYNRSFIHEVRKYSEDLANLYASSENNLVTEKSRSNHLNDFLLHLPAGATIEWPVMPPEPIIINDNFRQWKLRSYIKYTLPPYWNGVLQLPFVCCLIKGNGQVVLNHQTYQIGEDALNQILREMKHYFATVEIKNSTGITEVYCLFNHAVINTSGTDTIILFGRKLKSVSIHSEPNIGYQNQPFINFSEEKKIAEAAWRYYDFYLDRKDSLLLPLFMTDFAEIDSAVVSESIQRFFHSFEAAHLAAPTYKAEQMVRKWAEMYPALKSVRFRKHFSFFKDPSYFFYMLAILEHSEGSYIFTSS